MSGSAPLGWVAIVRLGLVQTALGAIVVLTTSTINRVMVVELMLPAILPGALVALHYAVQILRPRWGHGADRGGRRTVWIIGGMALLAAGATGAAIATALMAVSTLAGVALAVAAFLLVGIGVGAAGTNLLALLASRVAPGRRAPAATIVWLMMIAGFVVTATVAGHFLDPFSSVRLVTVTAVVSVAAFLVAVAALWGVEARGGDRSPAVAEQQAHNRSDFRAALAAVWAEPEARRFTIFVFVSMLAYSAQDLVLEPFAGAVFAMTPGQSTQLAGVQHGGVLIGMIVVALAGAGIGGVRLGTLRGWTIGGCLASAAALALLAVGGSFGPGWPLVPTVFALGAANGVFAVAAIGSMMALAGAREGGSEGIRMGLWGAGQAIAFALGGFVGTAVVDGVRLVVADPAAAYVTVFALEALLFLLSAGLAARVSRAPASSVDPEPVLTRGGADVRA
ncbi:BCD family MFS transporter [Amorphus orientalis]|uniref:BCD family chlorophyll transporter-like MFS transporter n=1 Tax=Amorphus orientalis TaxID=649198 RepID=A0AAE3VNP6_9HYPH|nr:BCD family MFS transporter [Amorphus orientalis]MDQ0315469.1 BCD family chlorophyll transporter-like MFS transporter [Amorphus orientalis]